MVCKVNESFRCISGGCVNFSAVCDGVDNCLDGSDETFTHAHCYDIYRNRRQMSTVEIVAVVVGVVVAVAVFCCILGTILECAAHVYKYWCPACVHRLCGRNQTNPRTPGYQSTDRSHDPIVLFVKAIPPNYSTVSVHGDPLAPPPLVVPRSVGPTAPPNEVEEDEEEDEEGDPGMREFNHAAVYGRQFYQGARGRQFYLASRGGRRQSGAFSRPVSSRGFDHVILPNRDYHHHHHHHHQQHLAAGRRDSDGGGQTTMMMMTSPCSCGDYYATGTDASTAVEHPYSVVPDCTYAVPHRRDLERVLISGEYLAYRLIRTGPKMAPAAGHAGTDYAACQRCLGSSQTSVNFRPRTTSGLLPVPVESGPAQPDVVSDVGSATGSYVAASCFSQTTFAICAGDDGAGNAPFPVARSPQLAPSGAGAATAHRRCFRDVIPPPSYASIVRK